MLKLEKRMVNEEEFEASDIFLADCGSSSLKQEKDLETSEADELELENVGDAGIANDEVDPLGDVVDYLPPSIENAVGADEALKNESALKCPICRMYFGSVTELDRHCMASSHKRLLCELCPEKYFEKQSELTSHKRNEHFVSKECEACKQLCTTYHQYQWHNVKHFGKVYECSVCAKKFSKQSKLSEHMNGHTGETPYRCEKCNLGFRYKISYINHNTRKHLMVDDDAHEEENKKLTFKCSFCEKGFASSRALAAHTRCFHTKTARNKCKECKKCFPNYQRLEAHEISAHGKKSPYQCHKCDRKPFASKGDLTRHVKNHDKKKKRNPHVQHIMHRGAIEIIKSKEKSDLTAVDSETSKNEGTQEKDSRIEDANDSYSQKEDSSEFIPQITEKDMKILVEDFKIEVEESIYIGNEGSSQQSSSSSLLPTFSGHEEIPTEKAGHSEQEATATASLSSDAGRKHKCRFCGMGFRAKYRVSEHERSHTGEKPYECPLCKKKFSTKRNLNDHDKLHTNAYTIFCEVCGRGCRDSAYLRHHLVTHAQEKPFKCTICKKGFTVANTLTEHLRLHTGEKPFKCQICLKLFTTKSAMGKHTRRNHTPKKKLGCDLCDEVFSRKIQFTRHMVLVHDRRDFPEVKVN